MYNRDVLTEISKDYEKDDIEYEYYRPMCLLPSNLEYSVCRCCSGPCLYAFCSEGE